MLNLDTHIVVKMLLGGMTRVEENLLADSQLSISAMVIWEISKLRQLGRIELAVESNEFAEFLDNVVLWPIDVRVALVSTQLDFRSDPADEIIAATSIVHGIPLVTRDERILASKVVPLARV
jgi:PIN domain nuclease of toxin-antitoxin system